MWSGGVWQRRCGKEVSAGLAAFYRCENRHRGATFFYFLTNSFHATAPAAGTQLCVDKCFGGGEVENDGGAGGAFVDEKRDTKSENWYTDRETVSRIVTLVLFGNSCVLLSHIDDMTIARSIARIEYDTRSLNCFSGVGIYPPFMPVQAWIAPVISGMDGQTGGLTHGVCVCGGRGY